MYARQLAWFNATPRPPDTAKKVSAPAPKVSRGEEFIARGGRPLFPDVGDAEYIIAYWFDLGKIQSGGMGAAPLSALEISAWMTASGLCLAPWEFRVLRRMSEAYLAQLHESEKPECPPPYGNPVQIVDRNEVSKKVGNAFRALIQAKRK